MWGMISLGDRVKNTVRGARKDTGRVVNLPMNENTVTIEYDDGDRVNVPIDNARKTRK